MRNWLKLTRSLRLSFYFSLLCISVLFGQENVELKKLDKLPKVLREVSGLQYTQKDKLLWMVNDSGNAPVLYARDPKNGKAKCEFPLDELTNTDWEDLAWDGDRCLFIADIGNNANRRKNLAIHHYELGENPCDPPKYLGTTHFRYQDQTSFPPKRKERKFDAEALVYKDGEFLVFTRHRDKGFDGMTNVYVLPAESGEFVAKKITSLKTCDDSRDCQITAADIHHSTGRIALLSYNKIWLLDGLESERPEMIRSRKIKLQHYTQKESLTFLDDNTLLIADERAAGKGPFLYRLELDVKPDTEGDP